MNKRLGVSWENSLLWKAILLSCDHAMKLRILPVYLIFWGRYCIISRVKIFKSNAYSALIIILWHCAFIYPLLWYNFQLLLKYKTNTMVLHNNIIIILCALSLGDSSCITHFLKVNFKWGILRFYDQITWRDCLQIKA